MDAASILEIVKSGGWALSPFLFWLWWRSDLERRETQSKLENLSERTIVIMTELKGLLRGNRGPA
jgi:hypothetical protein